MDKEMIELLYKVLLACGSIGTLVGAWFVFVTLKANHDWGRRRYAIDMLEKWNSNVYGHLRTIEQVYPHIRHYDKQKANFRKLSYDEVKELWACDPDKPEQWKVKMAMMELLNYFEFVTTAYSEKVADASIVEHSFKNALLQWSEILSEFIKVAEEGMGFQPWKPFLDVVAAWKAPIALEKRKSTA